MAFHRACTVALFVGLVASSFLARESVGAHVGLENLLGRGNLDLAVTKAYIAGKEVASKEEDIAAIAEPSGKSRGWHVGMPSGTSGLPISYVIGLRETTEIGSIHFSGTVSQVSILKAGAPYPPDPGKPEQWQEIAVPPKQSGGALVAMPEGTKTRALLFTAPHNRYSAQLYFVRLLSARLANIVPLANAYAESEYVEYSQFAPPRVYAASLITSGSGVWQNCGKDDQAKIHRAPVTDLDPSWFVLSWDEPQTIEAIWANDNFDHVRIESYAGPKDLNPRAGTDAEWNVIKDQKPLRAHGRLVSFPAITTRGIRLTILKTHDRDYPESPIARIDGLQVFARADGKSLVASAAEDTPPPVVIRYKMDFEGEATMVINGPDGRRVKNLFARRNRSQGENEIGWDLKDEQGRMAPPGTYEWKSIAHPPLHLKYEFTVYPNVGENSPVNPGWHTSMSGHGGWLADHTSNMSGTAGGDYVFFGAPVAESGVSMICCDLTGRKLWAIPSFAGFTGAYHAAATPDGKTVYVSAPGGNMQLDPRAEVVWAVDVESHKFKEIARLLPTSARQRGIQSMVARNGKLYIAVGAQDDWFASAAGPDDVDIAHCIPIYAAAREPKYPHEVPPNPRDDFERLFRLTGMPAGGHSLTYIESLPGKSPRRYVALLFNKPIPIGSAVLPVPTDPTLKVKLFVLKPDAPYPPNPGDPKQWIPFSTQGKLPWDVATAPPNTRTRALRIMFSRGDGNTEDELLGNDDSAEFKLGTQDTGSLKLKGKDSEKDDATTGLGSGPAGSWVGKLEGLKILSRRFENVAVSATVQVNSGVIATDGAWDAKRTQAISDTDPGIYMMTWKTPRALRGLAFKEIDGKRTEVDVYTGPDDKPIDMKAAAGWQNVATYTQARREYYWPDLRNNVDARYLDGYVDFGDNIKTRAVRLRVCEQWQSVMGSPGTHVAGPRFDVKGTDSTRCRIFGVAAMSYVGGEGEAVDPRAFQRIETLNPETGKIDAEVPLAKPVAMAFDQQGALFGICGRDVMAIDVATGKTTPLAVGDLLNPRAFAIDKAGNFYVYDQAPDRKNIRVYSPAGKFLRTIGTPGGYRVGPWDPTRFQNITTLVIDSQDQLWAVDNTYFPKRISLWSLDGTWKKDFLGNTAYGGGGVLDPQDKTRLFYGPLEFSLDWKTGHSYLKNLTWLGDGRAGEEPIYVNGRNYMVTRFDPPGPNQECGIVYLYEKDHLRRVAALGHASEFPPLTKSELQSQLGNPSLLDSYFAWSDLNGDGEVQANEVIIRPKRGTEVTPTRFDETLGMQSQTIRFQVNRFLADGTPVYEIKEMPGLVGLQHLVRLNDGNFTGENPLINGLYAPDGKPIWTYPNQGLSTHGLTHATAYTPEQIVSEFSWVSHSVAHAGDLGEFFFIHSNTGIWNLWTADGLLAGGLFSDLRLPGVRAWNMTEHERGMSLDNLTPGQEHFSGYFCRTSDNKYYAIAGHNHISLVEVLGIEQFKRSSGKIQITPAEVVKTEAWAQAQQRHKVYQRTPVLDCYRVERPMPVDASTRKWDTLAADFGEKDKGNIALGAMLHCAFDDKFLYLCYDVRGLGPMKNTGEQWDRLFKTGAAVDLHIGTDPNAPRDRKAPVAGDKRLLLTIANGKPAAVLYDAVVPGTPSDASWKAVSPVGQVSFDRVVQLPNVRIASESSANRYVLEAAVPLETIGLKPVDDMRLKMDWGLLSTDPEGNSVMQRIYWSNGATGIIADVPSEATLHPDLWGYVLFHDRSRHPAGPGLSLGSKEGDNPKSSKKSAIKDIERELNGEK